jgi:FMN phosphatase YigB (HAD superfamily)
MALTAVGFDLDGTLYPNHRFWVRLLPFLARGMPLLLSMGKARDKLRAGGHDGHFYSVQAELASRHLKRPAHEVRELIDEKIYRGWEPLFSRVRPRRGVREEVLALKAAGLKVGILSDFPIGNKLDLLGLGGIWDALVCSEEVGKLKPAPEPFLALAAALGADPEDMAYVGNSERYDIAGSAAVGMRPILIASRGSKNSEARIVARSFRGLAARIRALADLPSSPG